MPEPVEKQLQVSTAAAWSPLLALLVLFVLAAATVGLTAEILILAMLGAACVAGVVAVRAGCSWEDMQRSTGEKLAAILPALLILLAIGMLIGTWVLAGTIPFLLDWGIALVHPRWLVLTAFLVTAVMSICTGTSWGSAGTLGVALMGTAVALDGPIAATAGAVISGAYFGDKMSPLSDSTNICALAAQANLYSHIRHMLFTALPSFTLAFLVYAVAGGEDAAGDTLPAAGRLLVEELRQVYQLNVWVLLPLVVVLVGVARRRPPALVLAASSAVAVVLGVVVQGFRVEDALAVAVQGFDVAMVASLGHDPAAFSELFARLLNRGGLYSMANTLVVILAAFVLAGALDASGALSKIIHTLLGSVRSTFGLISSTMTAGGVMISLTSHGGVTSLIVGELFQQAYEERDLAPENLSRSLEDSITLVDPLLPWTVSGIFMAGTLGVPTLEYLPWAVFCYGGPLFSLIYAALAGRSGLGILGLGILGRGIRPLTKA